MVMDEIQSYEKYYLTDLAKLESWRESEQKEWSASSEPGKPWLGVGTSPLAAEWDEYLRGAKEGRAKYFLHIRWLASYDEDEALAVASWALQGKGLCTFGSVDGEDIFGFETEEARSRFAKWCDTHVDED